MKRRRLSFSGSFSLGAAVVACALLLSHGGHVWAQDAEPVFLYTTVPGDTLIGLGKRLLVNPAQWPQLTRANALRNPNQIATGTALRIPLRLMQTETVPATVITVVGEARGGAGATLQAGALVAEGGEIGTGTDGHVTIRLVDGTVLRLRPNSRLAVRESRRVPAAGSTQSGARIDQGRVEVEAAPAQAGRPGFRIDTPQGVLGVRGTEFRVGIDPAQGQTRGEVLGGTVAVSDPKGGGEQRVGAGFGTVIDNAGQVAPPVRLLDAPVVAALPALQERLLMRFVLPAMAGASAYRGQVARDATFDQVVADLTSPTPELRFAELADGDYVLRVRGIDAKGLEGRDADHRFRLKARPEAPLPSAPAPRAVSFGDRADFTWAANNDAQTYRLRLAADPAFKTVLRDLKGLTALAASIDGLVPGTYHWQLASVRAGDDQGPWGDVRSFELRPPPPNPKQPQVGDSAVGFAWDAAPGQTFEFQVARDLAFTQRVLERKLTQPSIDLPLPGTGRFYVRLRATDPDGFVGPYTTPQYFDVPNCLRDGNGGCVRAGTGTLDLAP
jgi:hypothetical protein